MKLKEDFITHDSGSEQIMVAVGKEANRFHGLVRSNKTAAFMIECLKQERKEEQIVDAVLGKYDVSRAVVAKDVHKLIADLRQIGAIYE